MSAFMRSNRDGIAVKAIAGRSMDERHYYIAASEIEKSLFANLPIWLGV